MNDFDDAPSPLSINDPYSDDWDDASFLGRLMEEALFDQEGYVEVEAAMVAAVSEGVDFATLGQIIRIIERVTLMLKRHVDAGDDYRIDNLDDEQVNEFDQRVRYCLLEISLGNAPDVSRWED
ncbi:MAG: hypothetical protein ABW136_10155 [Steroidobacteraceae bacterium]